MGNGTTTAIGRIELREAVYTSASVSRIEADGLVEDVLGEIARTLARGEAVKLTGFGTFIVRSKSERVGRNPMTGVEAPITARRTVSFKPSATLKRAVNGEAEGVGED